MSINETVLEMHYHRPLMDIFRNIYGVGSGKINFFKYSPQREVFLGFDQAFAMTELTDDQFFNELKTSAMQNEYKLPSKFIAFFLQFKVVTELKNKQKTTPLQVKSKPHYRASLDTAKNENTGFSQHELLFNLNKNHSAEVYYACPMVFDKSELYDVNVDLGSLRLVDLSSCPSDFSDNSKHYIYFDQKQSTPIWCSEPVEGVVLTPELFCQKITRQLRQTSPEESVEELRQLLSEIKKFSRVYENTFNNEEKNRNGLSSFSDSLIIVRIDEPNDQKDGARAAHFF